MKNTDFFSMWYVIQTAVMNSSFMLHGELSAKQTEFVLAKKSGQADLYSKIRDYISPAILDETNATERTKNYPTMYHNDFFKQCCEQAGITINHYIHLPVISYNFVKSIINARYDFDNLLALFMVTEEMGEGIIDALRVKFEALGASGNSLAYIEVHDRIEGHHAQEAKSILDFDYYKEDEHRDVLLKKVDQWRKMWREVLEELELV